MSTITIPRRLDELLELLRDRTEPALFLAGGTDFNVQRKKLGDPQRDLFLIANLAELQAITIESDRLVIGSGVTFGQFLAAPDVRRFFPELADSLGHFASPAVRNLATLGGNLANGSPTADSVPPFLVANASLELRSVRELRRVPLREFFTGYKRNVLRPNELIAAVSLPLDALSDGEWFYRKVGGREDLAIAKLSIAGWKRVETGRLVELRVAVGALNEYPRRLPGFEAAFLGREPHSLTREEITEFLRREITPLDDLRSTQAYRFAVCRNLLYRWIAG